MGGELMNATFGPEISPPTKSAQQRSSEQTSGDHTEKPDVTIMSHFELP
jgi:hypothetical protein